MMLVWVPNFTTFQFRKMKFQFINRKIYITIPRSRHSISYDVPTIGMDGVE